MPLNSILSALERALLTLWVGGLWVTGLVHAPVLFASFERMVAGEIAGRLFSAMSLVGLACGVVLLVATAARTGKQAWRDWRVVALAMMLLLVAIGEFGLAARMREIKMILAHHAEGAALWQEFRFLHAVSSVLYGAVSLLGLVLVVAGLRPRLQSGS